MNERVVIKTNFGILHENCLQHFLRLVCEGWRVLSINKEEARMLSPDGRRTELVDLLHDLVTYYWNSVVPHPKWANFANAVDGDIDTDATCTEITDETLELDATNAPGTDLGTITKREYRIYGLSSNAWLSSVLLQGQLVVSNLTISPEGWSSYYDVTAFATLAWADLPSASSDLTYHPVAGSPSFQVSRVELRITYSVPAIGLENKSANMGSKMVAAGLI